MRHLSLALAGVLIQSTASAQPSPGGLPRDALYSALHGAPEEVDSGALVGAPGRYVGRAVRTRGRLAVVNAGAGRFDLVVGKSRIVLRLEPEARALVAARSATWESTAVIVEGFFFREAGGDAAASPYALRAWLVWPASQPEAPRVEAAAAGDTPRVSLQDLVYGAGKFDGRVVRVRGTYRGTNRHADLPERTRKGRGDWVIKDGYYAAWVTGREARGENWVLAERSPAETQPVLEIVGVPATSGGVVRITARDVDLSLDFVGGALAQPRDAGLQSVAPRISFAWPIAGEPLRGRGEMILQFSKQLDPQSLESRVRVRYTGAPAPATTWEYRQRYRALVITPEPPPPPGTEVVVELLDGIIDVDGRALVARAAGDATPAPGVIDAVRFRGGR